MKRILLLILGYYLVIQAGIGALSICGQPELTVYLLPLSALSGWGGYKLIQKAKSLHNETSRRGAVPCIACAWCEKVTNELIHWTAQGTDGFHHGAVVCRECYDRKMT